MARFGERLAREARWALLLAAVMAVPATPPAAAQEPYAPAAVTAEAYERARGFLPGAMAPLVYGGSVRPEWLEGDRFWYRNTVPGGAEFILVDPARGTRRRAFDHARLAAALSQVTGERYGELRLPFWRFDLAADGRSIVMEEEGRRWRCDIRRYRCAVEPAAAEASAAPPANSIVSPDGRRAAFIRGHDLWVRELATGEERRLTTDGEPDFGYATNNAGWTRSATPVLLWSPDSRRIATFQHDARGVGEMYLVTTNVGHPRLDAWKYPLPEDSVIFRIHRVIIDVDAPGGPRVVRLRMEPDAHRSTVCDHVVCRGAGWVDVEWTPDATRLAFVSSSRDHKRATLRIADAATGEVHDVLEETAETFYESGYQRANWRVLPETGEVIWYSQRDDRGHLYLYDLASGALKSRITGGDWNVLQLLRVDPSSRTVWFIGNGRERGDPYFQYLYRVRLDGTGLELLTPDSANHQITLSPTGRWFIDAASTPTTPPVTVLRDAAGREVVELERADITRLVEAGWQPPVTFTVKARDGVTDLHGLLYRPTWMEEGKKYPIVNHIYPGPQSGSVGSRSFAAARGDAQALAELGFVVVQLDAMGTPLRSKSFHAAYYGNMGDNGLPDQVAGMRQLAERFPWIDIERAGIWGHSGGGYAAADAILRYPDFFKVAVSQAGNHDNRNYEDDWGEKWQGLLRTNPDGSTNYDNQANQLLARNLKGKLLLAHGTMDDNVPPYNTLLLVDALIAADRDFDLILFPNRRHGFGNENYMMRRRWDYFVRHLLGAEPPSR